MQASESTSASVIVEITTMFQFESILSIFIASRFGEYSATIHHDFEEWMLIICSKMWMKSGLYLYKNRKANKLKDTLA